MNVEVFEEIGYYFKQSLNLVVYAYEQIKKDKSDHPYSRYLIHKEIECKRFKKYAQSFDAYIGEDGMMRFISGKYYGESRMALAGMIAFVEVDLEKEPGGYLPIDQVAEQLQQKINAQNNSLKTTSKFSPFKLTHKKYPVVSNFKYSYVSKHIRSKDNQEISIHHLLLDYYAILVS